MELPLALTGVAVGNAQPVRWARSQIPVEFNWLTIAVMAAVTVVIVNALFRLRRGKQTKGNDQEDDLE